MTVSTGCKGDLMSKERIQIAPEFFDIMPIEYQDLVSKATYGQETRGWKDIGTSKELIEEHSLCAGCPESMAFRYILASLPNPEDTVMVGSTGCTSLVFPHVALHNIQRCGGARRRRRHGGHRTRHDTAGVVSSGEIHHHLF